MSDPIGLVDLRAVVRNALEDYLPEYTGLGGGRPTDVEVNLEALQGMLRDWEADRERLRELEWWASARMTVAKFKGDATAEGRDGCE